MASVRTADGRSTGARTREDIIEALREYAVLYGDAFTSAAFNPATARWRGRPELQERYYAGRPNGRPWPSLNSIKDLCDGSFNAAREMAGLAPNRPGPAPGTQRRANYSAEPILNQRVERVTVESDRDRSLSEKLRAVTVRAERAEKRAQGLTHEIENLRARKPKVVREYAEPRIVAGKPEIRVKEKIVKEKVIDTKKVDRLTAKLADQTAARRAADDQLQAAIKDRDESRRNASEQARQRSIALDESKTLASEVERLTDRLNAAEKRVDRLRRELHDAQAVDGDARERAVVADLVAKADKRAEMAEVRAARAERQMSEQGAAVTGEMRKLTQSEMVEMRATGPAGPVVLAGALKQLAAKRKIGSKSDMSAALMLVARAALAWRDRL